MLARFLMLFGIIAAMLIPATAKAERRVALVIGNSAYKYAATLRNPGNDARDVADTLKKVGFDVLLATDLDQPGFAQTIEQFARYLDEADVALFFYAGHGLQMNEKNYLVSVNAKLENEFLLPAETFELDSIVRLMESKSPVNLVFLDACRNNPLAENLRRSLTAMKRSVQLGRGLARMEVSGRDTLIAFAAAPGQEASDGAERNSPFTGALLKHLPKPGVEVSVMLKEVAADVRRDTRNGQRPQQLSDMTKTFYFAKAEPPAPVAKVPAPSSLAAAPPAAAPGDDRALDLAYWNAVQSSNDCDAVRAYLTRFPQGLFVELAKLSERRWCAADRKTAAADPVTPPPPPAARSTPEVRLPAPPDPTVTRDIQLELIRLGCASGDAKDTWTPQARHAVRKFNLHAKANLDVDRPSADMLPALRGHEGRACPLECARGTRAQGDVCVAIERERAQPAKTRRAAPEPRERKKAASARATAERPARERAAPERAAHERAAPERRAAGRPAATAASPQAEFSNPLCTSRIQTASGKWCCSYDPPRGATVVICR